MLLYNLRLAAKSIRRHPVLTGLIVAGIALGVAVSTTFLTVYNTLSRDPIPGKSEHLHYVRLDSWDPRQAYSDDGEPPQQVTYQDLRRIMRSDVPTRQAGMFKSRMYIYPEKAGDRPFREMVRLTFSDFFPMFNVPFRYGSGWSRTADEKPEPVVVIGSELNSLEPYSLTDLRVSRTFAARALEIDASLGVENLLDRDASMLVDYPFPGRSWSVSLRTRW